MMKSSSHTLRVQILDREGMHVCCNIAIIYVHVFIMLCVLSIATVVRQLEQRVKAILDSIATSEERKRELIRGDAVDKAEQLSKFTA